MKTKTFLLTVYILVFFITVSESSNVFGQADCPNVLPMNIEVNSRAHVIPEQGNINVRDAPTVSGNRITQVEPGSEFLIVDGPVCNDGYRWWLIQIDESTEGWLADGDNEDYWIEQIVDPSTTCYTTPDGMHSFRYPSDWYVDIASVFGFRSIVINNIEPVDTRAMVRDALNNQFSLHQGEIYVSLRGPTTNASLLMLGGFKTLGGKRYYASEETSTVSGGQEIISIRVSIETGERGSGLSWDVNASFRPDDRSYLEPIFMQILGSLSSIPCEPPPPEPDLTLFGGGARWNIDGTKILTWFEDVAAVWDGETGKLLVRLDHTNLTFQGKEVYTFAGGAIWSPDETIIITWSHAYMHFWDASTGKLLFTTDCKCDPGPYIQIFQGVVPSPDGNYLLSYGEVGTQVWDYEGNLISQLEKPISRLVYPENGRTTLTTWNESGTRIFGSAGGGTLVWIWDPFSNELLADVSSPSLPSSVSIPAWSPRRNRYLWVQDNMVYVADGVNDNAPIIIDPSFEYGVEAVWSSDGTKILIGDSLGNVLGIFDSNTGESLLIISEVDTTPNEGHSRFLDGVLNTDNSKIAVNAFDEVYIYDANSGELLQYMDGYGDYVLWSPDGTKLISMGDNQVYVWDLTDPLDTLIATQPDYVIQVQQILFSDDETQLQVFGQVLNVGGATDITTDITISHALTGQILASQELQPLDNEEIVSFEFSIPISDLPQADVIPLTAIVGIPDIEVFGSETASNNYYTFGVALDCPPSGDPCAAVPDPLEINEGLGTLMHERENITYYANANDYAYSDLFLSGLDTLRDDTSLALDVSGFGVSVIENVEDYGDGSLTSVDVACTLIDATLLSQEALSTPEFDNSSQQTIDRLGMVCVAIDIGNSLVLGAAASPAGVFAYLNFVINIDYIEAGQSIGDFVDNLFLDRVNDWATSCPISRYIFPELCESQ